MFAIWFAVLRLGDLWVAVNSFGGGRSQFGAGAQISRSLRDYASEGERFAQFSNIAPAHGGHHRVDEMPKQNLIKTVFVTKPVPFPFKVETEKKVPRFVRVPVEKPYPIYVPKPYIVAVEKPIHYPIKVSVPQPYAVEKVVPVPVNVAVEKEVPVYIQKPYPVYKEKLVGYTVEKPVPYPVKVPYDRPIAVRVPVEKPIPYPVEKQVPYPVYVPEERYVPVPVEKPSYPAHHETPQSYPTEQPAAYPIVVPFQTPAAIPVHLQLFKPEPFFRPIYVPDDPVEQASVHNEEEYAASAADLSNSVPQRGHGGDLTSASTNGEGVSESDSSEGSRAPVPAPSSYTLTATHAEYASPAPPDSNAEGNAPVLHVQEYSSANSNTTTEINKVENSETTSTSQSSAEVSPGIS